MLDLAVIASVYNEESSDAGTRPAFDELPFEKMRRMVDNFLLLATAGSGARGLCWLNRMGVGDDAAKSPFA